jgi:hypothetical protein
VAEPLALASVMSTDPPSAGGAMQESSVSLTAWMLAAERLPKRIEFSPASLARKPVPRSVTRVPPAAGPEDGVPASRVGRAW